jgi:hypothetical protein
LDAGPVFALAIFEPFVFLFVDDVLLFAGRCGRRRRVAVGLVVFGRVLRNAPRTSSSGSCALTINKAPTKATTANNMMKLLDLI